MKKWGPWLDATQLNARDYRRMYGHPPEKRISKRRIVDTWEKMAETNFSKVVSNYRKAGAVCEGAADPVGWRFVHATGSLLIYHFKEGN